MPIAFTPGFSGLTHVYASATDASGTWHPWVETGTWLSVPPDPVVSSLSPTSGTVETVVTVTGQYFGATRGTGTVTVNGVYAPVRAWSDTSLTIEIPEGATTGAVVVRAGGRTSNTNKTFTLAGPILRDVSPSWGPVPTVTYTTTVTLSGEAFGSGTGTVRTHANEPAFPIVQWTPTQITVTVPAGVTTGPLTVTTAAGQISNARRFTVADEETVYFHTDAIGSVRMITAADGAVVTRHDYRPFGEEWPPSDGEAPIGFARTEKDPETGNGSWSAMNYLGARHLHASSGRFSAVDPGHVNGNILDSQSWNGYAYARNNPLKFIDPDGRLYMVCFLGDLSSCGTESDISFEGNVLSYHGSALTLYPSDPVNGLNRGRYTVAGIVGFGAYEQLWKDVPDESATSGLNGFAVADVSNGTVGLVSHFATGSAQQLQANGLFSMNGKVYKMGFRGNQYVPSSAVSGAKVSQHVLANTGRLVTRAGAGVGGLLAVTDVHRGGASNQSLARGAVGVLGTGSAFIPYVGPFVSLGVSVTNAGGGFDWLYNYFDNTPRY